MYNTYTLYLSYQEHLEYYFQLIKYLCSKLRKCLKVLNTLPLQKKNSKIDRNNSNWHNIQRANSKEYKNFG